MFHLLLERVQAGSNQFWQMSKNSGYKFGLVVAMLHLCLSLLSGLDPGLEGVQEAGTGKGTL